MKIVASRTLVRSWSPIILSILFAAARPVWAQTSDLHLPSPTFTDATETFQAGRFQEALAILDNQLKLTADEDLPLEALVLRATLYEHLSRHQESLTDWQAVIERAAWMRTFARRALVKSFAGRDLARQSESILSDLASEDLNRHLDVTLIAADAYRNIGDTMAARRLYRHVVNRQPRGHFGDAGRLGIAASWEQEGDMTSAIVALHETKIHHSRPTTFEVALTSEHRLIAQYGVTPHRYTKTQYRTLVRRLRGASRFKLARELIEDWRNSNTSEQQQDQIEAEWIATLYAQRANEEGVTACQEFYKAFPQSTLLPSIRLTDFRLAVRMVDTSRAKRNGLDIWEGRIPSATSTQRRSAATLLAAYLVAVGDVTDGLNLYRELFQSSQSADEERAILWRAGVAALRTGQTDRALVNLRSLIDRNPSGELVPAGLYWLGVAELQGNTGAGIPTLESVVKRFPYHYYGIRAQERLKRLTGTTYTFGEAPLRFPQLSLPRRTTDQAEYRAAMTLARAGLVDDAAWYLRRLLSGRDNKGLALMAARASAQANSYANVGRILVNHFSPFLQRRSLGLPDDFWRLVYPRPFWDAVTQSGANHGVDPFLLVSLMRQESQFDPDARSNVGAIGLFQIMTYTAKALAQRAGVANLLDSGSVNESTLARPAVNSAIAARLTADLLGMFEGANAPVAASYNAGEDRVAIWWAAASNVSEDFFVDTIPYSETRRFVREVLANRVAYERIYGGQ